MSEPAARSDATAPSPAFVQLHRALADLALASGERAPLAQHTMGRHLAFLPPEALELDLSDPAQRDFGDYELLAKLGQGGMGVVYRARQKSLEREVAVKLLAAGPWASRDFIERFRREAQSAARMQHPNIVSIFEVGAHDNLNYFSMQLVRGDSLAGLLSREGALAPRRAAMLLRTVAEAVDYAHRLGVLHLDLKPGNVLIDGRGEAQVADFGLARRLDETLAAGSDEISGTPSYMAPEQALATTRKLTPATDVYGLGAILYELLTGRPPFLGPNPHETLNRVATSDPERPRALMPAIPPELEAICLRCLQKDGHARYTSGRALAEELTRFLEGRPVSAHPLNAPQRLLRAARREPRIASLLVLLALALVAGMAATSGQWQRAERAAAVTRTTLWESRRAGANAAIARDDGFGALRALLANVREQEAHGADAAADRLRIGLTIEHAPRLIDLLPFGAWPHELVATADGSRVAVATLADVSLIDTAHASLLWTRPIAEVQSIRFESDETVLQLAARTYNSNRVHRKRWQVADGSPLPLRVPGNWREAHFSVDGRYALLGRGVEQFQLWNLPESQPASGILDLKSAASLETLRGGRLLEALADGAWRLRDGREGAVRWHWTVPAGFNVRTGLTSPDEGWIAMGSNEGQVALIDITSGGARFLPEAFRNRVNRLTFSPDGGWVAGSSRDRQVLAWDTRDAVAAALPIPHAEMPTTLALDRNARLLFTNDNGRPRLWRLPEAPSALAPAVPVGPMLLPHGARSNTQPLLLIANAELALTGGVEHEIRFWRLPANPMLSAHAAPVATADLTFDGANLVAVDGRSVRVLDPWSESAHAPPLEHSQPVRIAALSRDGAVLFVAAGDEVHRWDWRRGQPAAPPLRLPNAIQRMTLHPRRAEVVVSVLRHADGLVHEDLWRIDASRKEAATQTRLPGPLGGWRHSSDGRQLLAWRGGALFRLDPDTLAHAAPELLLELGSGARFSDADSRDRVTWAAVRNPYSADDPGALWRFEDDEAKPRWQRTLANANTRIATVAATGDHAILAPVGSPGRLPMRRYAADGSHLDIGEPGTGAMDADASPDGRWLAAALVDGMRLFDGAGEPVGPPLRAALDYHDRVEQLAYAADGGSVLARTIKGRWLLWRIAAEARPAEAIARELDTLLLVAGEGVAPLRPDPGLRTALRQNDPGPRPARPAPLPDPNLQPPSQALGSPAHLLDLSAWTARTAHEHEVADMSFDLRRLALGRQRFDGIEFDLRGVVQLVAPGAQSWVPAARSEVNGIAVPAHVSALQLLVGDYLADRDSRPFLDVVLHYRDGAQRSVSVALSGHASLRESAPTDDAMQGEYAVAPVVLMVHGNSGEFSGTDPLRLYRIRVENPEPGRALATLGLRALRRHPYVAAISAEPVEE